jgi:hypothetical protein
MLAMARTMPRPAPVRARCPTGPDPGLSVRRHAEAGQPHGRAPLPLERWDPHRQAPQDPRTTTCIAAPSALGRSPAHPPPADLGPYVDAHPECVANALPQDLILAAISAALLVLAPAIVVWAG